jgi:hypothetical protein
LLGNNAPTGKIPRKPPGSDPPKPKTKPYVRRPRVYREAVQETLLPNALSNGDFSREQCTDVQRQHDRHEVHKFEEAQHPRHPAGTSEGGQFAPKEGENTGTPIPETEDEILRRAKDDGLDPLIKELEDTEVKEPSIPEAIKTPDLRTNAVRIAVEARQQYAIGPLHKMFPQDPKATTEAFLKGTAEHEAVLREMPLGSLRTLKLL